MTEAAGSVDPRGAGGELGGGDDDAASGRHLLLVGPMPPPSGGIASHIHSVTQVLRGKGWMVRTVDPASVSTVELLRALLHARYTKTLPHLHVCGHNRSSYLLALVVGMGAVGRRGGMVTIHSGLAPDFLDGGGWWLRGLVRWTVGCFSSVVAVNSAIAGSLVAATEGEVGHKLAIIPAWVQVSEAEEVDCVRLPVEVYEVRERSREVLVAHLGVGPEYGGLDLLRAFAQMRPAIVGGVGLVLMGSGSESPELRQGAERLGILGDCVFCGDLDRIVALAVVAKGDLFVRPTLADGDSGSVREALALGKPVVATDVGSRPLGVRLCRPGDPADLARVLLLALDRKGGGVDQSRRDESLARLLELYEGS